MNRKSFLRALAVATLAPIASIARAGDSGKPAEAEALVTKAAAYIRAHGAAMAYEQITDNGMFTDRDLHIVVYDLDGRCLAHGANPRLVGADLIESRDPDGKPLVKLLVDMARDTGRGWTGSVKFRNPLNDRIQGREHYIERVGDTVVVAGVFNPD